MSSAPPMASDVDTCAWGDARGNQSLSSLRATELMQ